MQSPFIDGSLPALFIISKESLVLSRFIRPPVLALLAAAGLTLCLYLAAAYQSGSWFPRLNYEVICITGLSLGVFFAHSTSGLRQLPLLFIIFSPLLIRPLSGMETSTYDYFEYLGFCIGIWGLRAALTPSSRFQKLQSIYLGFSAFLLTLVPLLFWLYYFTSNTFPTPEILLAIMQTNPSEAFCYAAGHISFSAIIALFCYLAMLYWMSRPMPASRPLWRAPWVWPLLAAAFFMLAHDNTDNLIVELPQKAECYAENYAEFQKKQKERASLLANLHVDSREKGLFVLVLGESMNSEHMGVYGYCRDTTPWLSSKAAHPNFFIFRDAYSCYVQTVPSLAYALTSKNQYNTISLSEAPSIIEAARAAGFTTAWVSNQVRYGAWDTPTSITASQADQQIWLNSGTGLTTDVDYQDDAVVDALSRLTYEEKMLVIIHLMGSHAPYTFHYPKEYNLFDDSLGSVSAGYYDNTIRFNDSVMEKLYEKLKNHPDFQALAFVSDHSEGIDQHVQHDPSIYVPAMTYIPFYMIFSDSYLENHKEMAVALRNHEESRFTNDLIFNAMTGLMDIHIPGIEEKENDITSPDYDDTPARFRTLYGERPITPRGN